MVFPKIFGGKGLGCKCNATADVIQPTKRNAADFIESVSEEVILLSDYKAIMRPPPPFPPRCKSLRSPIGSLSEEFMMASLNQTIVVELPKSNMARTTVETIFKSSWINPRQPGRVQPHIDRVLKVINSQMVIARFERYRDTVKSRAAAVGETNDNRCMVDGNEVRRFHPTILSCPPHCSTSPCNSDSCPACKILRQGFRGGTVYTTSTSYRAHHLTTDVCAKKAILICRVIAGNIQIPPDGTIETPRPTSSSSTTTATTGTACSSSQIFDSIAVDGSLEELIVFNPSAILPCFLVVYSHSAR